jgi:hypothetical protein
MKSVPGRIRIGGHRAGTFQRRDGMYAVRAGGADDCAGCRARIADGARSSVAVYEGHPPAARRSDDLIPVYSAGPQGPLAVPTGRVFVRFADGTRAEERRGDLEALGFTVERVLSYAPNAVWVTPTRGGPARALEQFEAIASLPGVVHAEPQLLLERARKHR